MSDACALYAPTTPENSDQCASLSGRPPGKIFDRVVVCRHAGCWPVCGLALTDQLPRIARSKQQCDIAPSKGCIRGKRPGGNVS